MRSNKKPGTPSGESYEVTANKIGTNAEQKIYGHSMYHNGAGKSSHCKCLGVVWCGVVARGGDGRRALRVVSQGGARACVVGADGLSLRAGWDEFP